MKRSMKNRFDVQVAFPSITFGIKNLPDKVLTPFDVADCLEEFCRRIRSKTHDRQPVAAPLAQDLNVED